MEAFFRSSAETNREVHHKYGPSNLKDMFQNLLQRNNYSVINKINPYDKRSLDKLSKDVDKVSKLCSQS